MAEKNRSGPGRSQRQLKVAEEIRHALSSIIIRDEFRNPILQKANLTVTEVRTSPDLRNATCFVLPLGGGEDPVPRDQILQALKGASVYLKTRVAQCVHLKYAPRLSFQYDESFDQGSHMDTLLNNPMVQADVAKSHEHKQDKDDFADYGAARRINYVEFKVTDIQRTKDFYGAAFGWSFTDYGPEYCEFDDGRMKGGFALVKPQEVFLGGPLIVFYAQALEDVMADVEKAGGRISAPIFQFPGGKRFHFIDPEGYELAVWTQL